MRMREAKYLMANPEHLAILKQGVKVWNRWRLDNPEILPDLRFARLLGADLYEANLGQVKLNFANLNRAKLCRANLDSALCSAASFHDASLTWSSLHNCNLHRATLTHANLASSDATGADFTLATLISTSFAAVDLRQTNFYGAGCAGTIFVENDLSATAGLEAVRHLGPSTIGLDTIFMSQGKIPHIFLRGAGVPEIFIDYLPSLVGQPIEFYSLFISYSTKDQDFAERLHADLQNKGVRCWFAPHDIQGGKKIHEQIDQAIRLHEKLLLILSPASMKSAWVETEISKARRREKNECRRVLFPIRLCSYEDLQDWEIFDADTGKDSAREIREYFIPDFSNWKDHDSYKKAFDRLLHDLKTEAAKP
jgi:uncharacterized protein YjbI with pentapeptide repeats